MRSRWIGILLLVALIGGALVQTGSPTASAATLSKVYWSDQGGQKVLRGELDGTNVMDLVSSPAPAGVAVDTAAGKVYWTNWVSSVSSEPSTIQRSNLDGTGVETVLTLTSNPKSLVGLALDTTAGKIYFMAGWNGEWNGELRRINLDGSGMETLVYNLGDPRGVTLDGYGRVYFSDAKADAIERINLDGSNREYVLTGLTGPFGIAVDVPGNRIWWTDTSLGAVRHANLDGTAVGTDISEAGLIAPGIALDPVAHKLYWGQVGLIRRMNTDGTNLEDVITGIGYASGIALDLVTYNFGGFYAPVDNLPVLNTGVKAGAAIPVKFSLGGDQGLNILAAGYPRSQAISCSTTDPADAIEATVTAGGSSLTYDPVTDQYTYVWKTDKAWAGQCRQLVVTLNDNTAHRANFKFK